MLLDNSRPRHESLDKHVGRLQIMRCTVFLDESDEWWVTGYSQAISTGPRDGRRARYQGQFAHVKVDGDGTKQMLTTQGGT